MVDLFNGALLLNQNLFVGLRESPQVVRQGLLVVILVGLLVGGVNGANLFFAILDPARAVASQRALFEQQSDTLATASDQSGLNGLVRDSIELTLVQFDLSEQLTALPTTLPRPVVAILAGVVSTINGPIVYLGGLLFTIALTHIAARQLGGVGNLQQMLGLGALSTAPHALDALGFIDGLGPILQSVAWGWGLMILVIATSVAHRLDSNRAFFAVALYPILLGLLVFIMYCGLSLIGAGLGL